MGLLYNFCKLFSEKSAKFSKTHSQSSPPSSLSKIFPTGALSSKFSLIGSPSSGSAKLSSTSSL